MGSWVPMNTMWPGSRPTFVPSGILIHPAIWPQQTWPKLGMLCPFLGGSWVPIQHNVPWAEAYLHTKWKLDPSSHLATRYGPKIEGSASGEEELGPHLMQFGQGRAEAYLHAMFPLDPSDHVVTMHQRHRQDNGPVAQGEPFYKRSPKNNHSICYQVMMYTFLLC